LNGQRILHSSCLSRISYLGQVLHLTLEEIEDVGLPFRFEPGAAMCSEAVVLQFGDSVRLFAAVIRNFRITDSPASSPSERTFWICSLIVRTPSGTVPPSAFDAGLRRFVVGHAQALELAGEYLVEQRLLQVVEGDELALKEGGEPDFFRYEIEFNNDLSCSVRDFAKEIRIACPALLHIP
jgi:hypothetical protein